MDTQMIASQIVQAAAMRNTQQVMDIYLSLTQERTKMDKWFNKYLDMFSDKMTMVEKSDSLWKLYDSKTKEYSKINNCIKTAEYYLKVKG